ncbi:uncharacterized protein B0I36DRAFT_362912 [Microdochium trichocladiopsis]|uniref:CFEM domain-containing protein n=1 Tax=Microdochium trichocladiopsis TaxID=1682393 RepID=A0A9P8Y6F0_9PEZI|nr:uncharacterized protein B0I36DRAFT_362912 [Microdochium trichocladiopsis]KAH7031181.1 hypothetical protein B0I36DRAFT_362912 [Microdochium trichocladiopsis]
MKAFFVASALVGAVLAQDLPALPGCATQCLTKFTTGGNIGSCQSLDAACICRDANFLSGIACCLAGACSQSDQNQAVDYAIKFCGAQGVTVPSSVSCSSSAASTKSGTSTTGAVPTTSQTNTAAGANTASSTSHPNAAHPLATPAPELIGGLLAALALL